MDFTEYPMGLIGGLVALFIFGVFIGTWWWYGMRVMARAALATSPRYEDKRVVVRAPEPFHDALSDHDRVVAQ
jgi:hypothetical protein